MTEVEPVHLSFLFAAYTLVWIGLFLYVLSLSRQNRGLERELAELRELLRQGKKSTKG